MRQNYPESRNQNDSETGTLPAAEQMFKVPNVVLRRRRHGRFSITNYIKPLPKPFVFRKKNLKYFIPSIILDRCDSSKLSKFRRNANNFVPGQGSSWASDQILNYEVQEHEGACKISNDLMRLKDTQEDQSLKKKESFLFCMGLVSSRKLSKIKDKAKKVGEFKLHGPAIPFRPVSSKKRKSKKRLTLGPQPSKRTLLNRFIKKNPIPLTSGLGLRLVLQYTHLNASEREAGILAYEEFCNSSAQLTTPTSLIHETLVNHSFEEPESVLNARCSGEITPPTTPILKKVEDPTNEERKNGPEVESFLENKFPEMPVKADKIEGEGVSKVNISKKAILRLNFLKHIQRLIPGFHLDD